MELTTLQYRKNGGWNRPLPVDLDSDSTLIIAFGAADSDRVSQPLAELTRRFPQSHRIGCSTAGEIYADSLCDDGLVVAIARFRHTGLATSCTGLEDAVSSFTAGSQIARDLMGDDLRGMLVLSEGLSVNGSELLRGMNSELPHGIVVTGGLAGDADQFQRTWVWSGTRAHTGRVCAVGFYGAAVRVGHGSKGGWDPFGVERSVTRSSANVLYELDGRPALDVYKHYLGERADGLPATGLLFPLSLKTAGRGEESVVRTILAIDEQSRSITFAGDIPEGSRATLMYANFERLISGASDAAQMVGEPPDDRRQPTLAIAISCVGRRLVLGERTEEEIEAALNALPENTQQIGFYSYGEISPLVNGRCDLHNQTMTLTTISEIV